MNSRRTLLLLLALTVGPMAYKMVFPRTLRLSDWPIATYRMYSAYRPNPLIEFYRVRIEYTDGQLSWFQPHFHKYSVSI